MQFGKQRHKTLTGETFAVVAAITQFMSDSAATAVFDPVAVALAQALGRAPEPYVVTVAMASVVAFLTPIGHHGNPLVYGPGRYKFGDFVKVGTPLTVLAAIVVVTIARCSGGADSCIQDVRSNCNLTEETARPRLRVLTKMNGRLYSLVPITLGAVRARGQHRDPLQLKVT